MARENTAQHMVRKAERKGYKKLLPVFHAIHYALCAILSLEASHPNIAFFLAVPLP